MRSPKKDGGSFIIPLAVEETVKILSFVEFYFLSYVSIIKILKLLQISRKGVLRTEF